MVRSAKSTPRHSRVAASWSRQSHRNCLQAAQRYVSAKPTSHERVFDQTNSIDLASAVGEFAQTVNDLATSDLGKPLSQSLGALAELERKAQETESAQARADQASLLSTADEYARLVNSVRVSQPRSRLSVYLAPTLTPKRDGVQLARTSVSRVAECRCGAATH